MQKVIIEVCPRMQDGQYHACIDGNTSKWSCGGSIETAAMRLISMNCEEFKIPHQLATDATKLWSTPTSTRVMLRKMMDAITEVEVEIRFLPSTTR